MTFRQVAIALVWLFGVTHAALAQSAVSVPASSDAGRSPAATSAPAPIDVSRLPIDLRRIQREFREASVRSEQDGLNLRYFVEVYGQSPPLVFFTKEDNLTHGPVPYGAPTHRDILWMVTPQAHRGSLYALPLFRIPIGGSKKGN
jgi:hypothetical protein